MFPALLYSLHTDEKTVICVFADLALSTMLMANSSPGLCEPVADSYISTVNMDGYDSNRHSVRPFAVLTNATNTLALRQSGQRHTPLPLTRALESFHAKAALFTGIAGVKTSAKTMAWDLKVTGAPLTIESITLEKAKSGSLNVNSGRFPDARQKHGCLKTPLRKRRVSVAPPFSTKTTDSSDTDPGPRSMPRSLSLERVQGQRRNAIYSSSSFAVRPAAHIRPTHASLFAPPAKLSRSPIPVRRPPTKVGKTQNESPTRIYARIIQRTSEQIEHENLQGWE